MIASLEPREALTGVREGLGYATKSLKVIFVDAFVYADPFFCAVLGLHH
jgi:hypothetical protein